jgi:hypothetical protein
MRPCGPVSSGLGPEPSRRQQQLATLNESSTPRLNFPAGNNSHLAPILAFGGMSIDGVRYAERR